MHAAGRMEAYEFDHDGSKYGLLGKDAISLVENVTSLLQMITHEKFRQGNLSIEWQMFCESKDVEYLPFAKEYGSRWTHNYGF